MGAALHHVIIGNGVAGSHAAAVLRQRDRESRITIISAGALLFYNRYELPDVFRGRQDWRDYLGYPPEFYEDNEIALRRKSLVADIDTARHVIVLGHREEVGYDQLLVATGGAAYLPERLRESRHLLHQFNTFRAAIQVYNALPEGGRVVLLGGDTIGLDLARTLIDTGYKVTVVAGDRTFWPHEIEPEERPRFLAALETMGLDVIEGREAERLEEGGAGEPARRVVFTAGDDLQADVLLASYGIVPAVDFMSGSGVDIERGLLVNPELRTTKEDIWAAGDVCQIWSSELNGYRFYYGWKNVKMMGDVAARNMTGDEVAFTTFVDETLVVDEQGGIHSPFWEYN
jgi:NAD(P)H-nitrite reductase large subunit